MEHPDIMPEIMDMVSRNRRITAALWMVRDLPTEDIETINEHFPHLAEQANHEILNPNIDAYGNEKPKEE